MNFNIYIYIYIHFNIPVFFTVLFKQRMSVKKKKKSK